MCEQVNTADIFYNSDNAQPSELMNLGIPNGTNLNIILALLDEQAVRAIDLKALNIPYLRSKYTIKSLKNILESIDAELKKLNK